MKRIHAANIKELIKTKKADIIIKAFEADGRKTELIIKPHISLQERIQLINDSINACFDENGEYMACVKEPVFWINILSYYTNVNEKTDISLLWDFISIYNIQSIADEITDNISVLKLDFEDGLNYKKNISRRFDLNKFLTKASDFSFDDTKLEKLLEAAEKINNKNEAEIVKAVLDNKGIKEENIISLNNQQHTTAV